MKYLWIIPVATADISVGPIQNYRGHRVYPVIAEGKLITFIDQFVKAHGTIKSYIDVNKLYPWGYEENAQAEGHSPSIKNIRYDHTSQTMEFEGVKRKIPENTQDPLSALFYLRWQNYTQDDEINLNINSNQENYTLLTRLSKVDSLNVNGTERPIQITSSNIKSPKRYSKSEAKITTYMLNDSNRIPFLIKVRTKFGPIIIRLIKAN